MKCKSGGKQWGRMITKQMFFTRGQQDAHASTLCLLDMVAHVVFVYVNQYINIYVHMSSMQQSITQLYGADVPADLRE